VSLVENGTIMYISYFIASQDGRNNPFAAAQANFSRRQKSTSPLWFSPPGLKQLVLIDEQSIGVAGS
jgi:hypothetical protein